MEPEHHSAAAHKYGPQREFLYQDWVLDFYKAGAANLNCNSRSKYSNSFILIWLWDSIKKHSSNTLLVYSINYLWFISVLNLEFFKVGNWSLSRNRGFASINFFNSTSIIALADFVSPYFESWSFSLVRRASSNYKKENREKYIC